MSVEQEVFYEVLPRGWWTLAAVVIGGVVFVALLLMLLISGAKFQDQRMPPSGTCEPFCTATMAPPPP